MPPLAVAAHLPVLLELGQDPIQVIGLDAHRLRELADGDAGPRADELERLVAAGAAAARAPAPAAARAARAAGAAPPAGARAVAATGRDARQGRAGGLEPVVLVHEGTQLLQPRVDLLQFFIQKVHVIRLRSRRVTHITVTVN